MTARVNVEDGSAGALLEQLRNGLAGRYRVERELGQGGMAVVYLATDVRHHRRVAIKVLRPEISAALSNERFRREIEIAAGLTHPHILSLHDSGEVGPLLYYVMPYVEGETLRDRLDREHALPLQEAVRIAGEIADALEYAHEHGVLHRDIKPENVLLSAGHAVLADFGIGRAITAAGEAKLTEPGMPIGTPAYMSPEQACSDTLDGRSDLYALGCVVYEMLAGEPPFTGANGAAVVARHVASTIPSIAVARPGVPEAVDEALRKALAKQPADRHPSAAAFATALRAGAGEQVAQPPRPAAPRRPAIVVLPFANLSPEADTEYLCDGLSDGILTDLSSIDRLAVISRTSALQLKGSTKSVRAIGRELGVRYVLEGTLRRTASHLRITTKLVDAQEDVLVWASKFTGTMDDVLRMEEQVSRAVIDALELQLSPSEDRRLAERPIPDVRAYDYYLRARQETLRFTEEALERALRLLQKGMDILGDNLVLLSSTGYVYWQYVNAGISPDSVYLAKARDCADRILAREPDSPHGHRLLGLIAIHAGGTPPEVTRHLTRALEQDPYDPDALLWLTLIQGFAGQPDAAAPLATRLLESDPLTPFYQMLPGFLALMRGDLTAAWGPFLRAHRLEPANPIVRQTYGQILAMNGRTDEAAQILDDLYLEAPDTLFAKLGRLLLHALRGEAADARAIADEELLAAARGDVQYAWTVAQCWALLGETELAIDWLESAVARGFWNHPLLARHDPFLAGIRGAPRFATLMRDVEEKWRSMRG